LREIGAAVLLFTCFIFKNKVFLRCVGRWLRDLIVGKQEKERTQKLFGGSTGGRPLG